MAITGRGNHPLNSEWTRGRGRGRGRAASLTSNLYRYVGLGISTAQKDMFTDWFFEAAAGGTTGQMKWYNGSTWVAKPVKWYNGATFVTKPVKYYNGATWVVTPY